tara:strand:+ start:253 stop:474 length:222 start_codon:yes stop_codon:yes gene_type:complete
MLNLSFVLTFLVIFIVAVLVGNYIAIDGDELSKSKKLYYKIISIVSVFVFLGSFVFFLFLVNNGNFGSGIKII